MVIRISKRVELLFLNFIFALVVLAGYVEYDGIWKKASLLVIFLCFVLSKSYRMSVKKEHSILVYFAFSILMVAFSVLLFGIQNATKENSLMFLYSVIVTSAISLLAENSQYIDAFFESFFYQLNILWIINLVVLFFQIEGIPLLIKNEWMLRNPFYEDLCCGLFGYNGTHRIAMYAILVMMYNWTCSLYLKGKKKGIIIYSGITLAIFMFCCTRSDNNFFFILFFVTFFAVFVLLYGENIRLENIFRYIVLAVLVLIIMLAIKPIREYINEEVFDRLYSSISFADKNINFRFYHTFWVIKEGTGLKFGKGIGFNTWSDSILFGKPHFGNNSLSELVCSFGILGYVLYTFFYSLCCYNLISNKISGIKLLVIWTYTITISIYTDIFSKLITSCIFLMIVACIGWNSRLRNSRNFPDI